MLSIPQYLIESSFCLAIFYGFYYLFLKKETFFQLNRAYLLATPIAALSIPLLNISFQKDAPPESLEAFFYPAIQSANNLNEVVWEQMRAPSPVFSLSVADIIMAIYLIGIFLMSFSLLKGLWNLGRIIRRGKRSKNNEFTLVETHNNFPAASFFGYIFWNQQITDEQKLILEHEKVHIRQWHSLDVLLMEICVIIKWFNPLIYWFRNALKVTHEFIADQYVIEQKSNVSEYATLLVNQHKQQVAAPLMNTFSALTKKRLRKMIQRPSRKVSAVKYLLLFPLLIGLMSLFSFNLLEEIPRVSEGLAEMNSVLEDIGDKTVFEIDQPFLIGEPTMLSEVTGATSSYKIHLNETKYNAGNSASFNSFKHSNELTLTDIQTLLSKPIVFIKENQEIPLDEIDLVIPNPNVSYRKNNAKTQRPITIGSEGEEAPFILKISKKENFTFPKSAINQFLKIIHNGSKFYINGYSEKEVIISGFSVNYSVGEISNKEMDRFFFFPDNPTDNKMKIGNETASIRGLKTGGTAAPFKIDKNYFFAALKNGELTFTQNGKPLKLNELLLTHAAKESNYTANIVKNEEGKFEVIESFNKSPYQLKTNASLDYRFPRETIEELEERVSNFDLIELRGKNKEDIFMKTVMFFENGEGQSSSNPYLTSTHISPFFNTPSIISNNQLKFKWGTIELPIWHRDNPVFKENPGIYITKEKLLENISAEMLVLDGNKIHDVHSMSLDFVFYNNMERDDPAYVFTPPFKLSFKQGDEMKLFPANQETLSNYIDNFGKIYIEIPELGDFHTIIIDVNNGKKPNPIIPESAITNYTYQVIIPNHRKTDKTVLRIDTTMAKNKRIVDMYRNPDKYHIIHIPNFQTKENLLWKDTDLIIKEDLNPESNHSEISPFKSQYNGHIGDYSFTVGNMAAFDSETYKHRITNSRLEELLSNAIRFTKNGDFLEMDGVEIVIPYPGAVYNFDHLPAKEEAFIDKGSDDGKPFRMTTNKAKGFQFSAEDLAEFAKIIQQGTKVFLNGYVGKEILTSHFFILENKSPIETEEDFKKMREEFGLPSKSQLKIGNLDIRIKSNNSSRMAAPMMISASELIHAFKANDLKFLHNGLAFEMGMVAFSVTSQKNEYGISWSRGDTGDWEISESYAIPPTSLRTSDKEGYYFSENAITDFVNAIPESTMFHFHGQTKDTIYSSNIFIHHEKKKRKASQYQLKWGNYTFNCREKTINSRKICNCEGLYINKADLTKMNTIGIQFLKNEEPVEFDNVFVNVNGHVYCKEADLMMSSDIQLAYNPDACIWNAFEEGDRGMAGFQTEELDNVYFNFAINSENGRKRIDPPILTIGKETFSLPHFTGSPEERPFFTFEQINKMVGQRVRLTHFGETSNLKDIKIQVTNNSGKYTFQSLRADVLEKMKAIYAPNKVFYVDFHQMEENTFNLYLSLHPADDVFRKRAFEFTWGDYSFSMKNPYLELTKRELTRLIQEVDMTNYLGQPISKVTGVKFLYPNETVRFFLGGNNGYDFKEMWGEPQFREKFARLKTGDLINIINLHTDFIKGGLTIFIKDDLVESSSFFDIQLAKGGDQNKFIHPFVRLYRNHSIATVVADLLDIHPSELTFRNKENLPKIHLTYKPEKGVDAKTDLLEKIKAHYPFTIKKKMVAKEAWFLSGGDSEKLANYEDRKILGRNFEPFKKENRAKGLKTVGPVKFDWFVSTYFKRNYQLDVVNLTDFKGKYIFPLDTESLPALQNQLEKDFGLILKKQKRSLDIQEVIFE